MEWRRTTEPAGTVKGLTVSRKIEVRSERVPSSSRSIFRHSPSPPVGKQAGKDWSASTKTTGQLYLGGSGSLRPTSTLCSGL